MKRLLASIVATLVLLSSALAATATLPNGSLSIVYVNAAGVVVYQPYATINNVTASQFLAWCAVNYANVPQASTSQGCFNTWANEYFNQTVNAMYAYTQGQAATAAAIAVAPVAIVPAQ